MAAENPFLIFEDARAADGVVRWFSNPSAVIAARRLDDVLPALAHVRQALQRGSHVAGWFAYEAGLALEPRLHARAAAKALPDPLLWFGLFDAPQQMTSEALTALLPDPHGAWLSTPCARMTRAEYETAFVRAKSLIVAGDIYQVNLSYRADVALFGAPRAAYAQLRGAGKGGWSGLAFNGETWLASTSPELFFRLSADGVIEAKPMKGTAKRRADPEQDRLAAAQLRGDPKQIAENVMIVDLLRNDLSRVAKRGSVRAPALFDVETYPTVHTLTSTVRADLREGLDAIDVVKALFPCGSITGAPKIRAMEIIDELETDGRGPYTGSMGWCAPDGAAEFNVAIRTLAISQAGAELGLGSGVVYDSKLEDEWEECATKGLFVTSQRPRFTLLETMRFSPGRGVGLLDLHLQRLGKSAAALEFRFDETAARLRIDAAVRERNACVVRLSLRSDGDISFDFRPMPDSPPELAETVLRPQPVDPSDFRLKHKTSLRAFYDAARADADAFEVVFVDAQGFVTEGSFTNVFVRRGRELITPPLHRGLLPGVLRAALLDSGEAREGDVRAADLAGEFYVGNAVRGLIRARLSPRPDPSGRG